MSPQSHAQQFLEALYVGLLSREAGARPRVGLSRGARRAGSGGGLRWALELLPRRVLLSATPLAAQFAVNTHVDKAQSNADVVVTSGRGMIAVWTSAEQDSDGSMGVFAQRFDASGNKIGGEFRVNVTQSTDQYQPQIALDANDDFTIVWTSKQNGNPDIFTRLYASDGTALTGEMQVSQTASGNQQTPMVAMDAAGKAIVAWDGRGPVSDNTILYREINATGTFAN